MGLIGVREDGSCRMSSCESLDAERSSANFGLTRLVGLDIYISLIYGSQETGEPDYNKLSNTRRLGYMVSRKNINPVGLTRGHIRSNTGQSEVSPSKENLGKPILLAPPQCC